MERVSSAAVRRLSEEADGVYAPTARSEELRPLHLLHLLHLLGAGGGTTLALR